MCREHVSGGNILGSEERPGLKKKIVSAFAINLVSHNDFRIFSLRQMYFPTETEEKKKINV